MDSLALCGVGKGLSLCLALQADRVRRAPFACALLMHVPKPPAVGSTPQRLFLFSLWDLGDECTDGSARAAHSQSIWNSYSVHLINRVLYA